MAESRIIIEHLVGARRGRRQEFAVETSVRFGRHPDSDVHFHAHRDMDASSRHAELCFEGDTYVLRDVGSSNGTFVEERAITEFVVPPGEDVVVEFGAGGPRVRVFIGDPDTMPPTPAVRDELRGLTTGYQLAMVGIVAAIVVIAVVSWFLLV